MNELNTLLTSDQSSEHTEFWKKTLDSIGGDFRLRPNWHSYALQADETIEHEFALDGATSDFIEELSRGKDIGVFVIVLAGVSQLIRIYSGSQTVLVDSPLLKVSGEGSGYNDAVPLVIEIQDERSVRTHLDGVRNAVSGSYTYQDFPIEGVAKVLLRRKARPSWVTPIAVTYRVRCSGTLVSV